MDEDLRRLQRRLAQSGQDFVVVPGDVARRALDYIEQELCRQQVIRGYFMATSDDEVETRDKLINELQNIVNDWKTNE